MHKWQSPSRRGDFPSGGGEISKKSLVTSPSPPHKESLPENYLISGWFSPAQLKIRPLIKNPPAPFSNIYTFSSCIFMRCESRYSAYIPCRRRGENFCPYSTYIIKCWTNKFRVIKKFWAKIFGHDFDKCPNILDQNSDKIKNFGQLSEFVRNIIFFRIWQFHRYAIL